MSFPDGFLWGTATSAHQVEGGNVYNDCWLLEHVPGTHYGERSGDACDHYHRYREDIASIAALGLGAYRFSVEWSRIEPEEGEFSRAALDHYRRMLDACHEHGLVPLLTLHHFTSPRWVAGDGGWKEPRTAERFARFCERTHAAPGRPRAVRLHDQRAEPGRAPAHGASAFRIPATARRGRPPPRRCRRHPTGSRRCSIRRGPGPSRSRVRRTGSRSRRSRACAPRRRWA